MGNVFADIGRGGGLSSAVTNLADRARQMRMDEEAASDKQFEKGLEISAENRAVSAENRAVRADATDIDTRAINNDTARQNLNAARLKLEEEKKEIARMNEVHSVEEIQAKYDSPATFDFDMNAAREAGLISRTDDGREFITGRDMKTFREKFLLTPTYRTQRDNIALNYWDGRQRELTSQVNQLGEQLALKGKDPQQDPQFKKLSQELSTTYNKYRDYFEANAQKAKIRDSLLTSGQYTPESVEAWSKGEGDLERIPKKGEGEGEGGGKLKAADRSLANKQFGELLGGTFDPRTGELTALDPTKRPQLTAMNAEWERMVEGGTSPNQAAEKVAESFGYELPKAAGKEAPQAEAKTVTTKAEYDALPKGALFIDPGDGKTYKKP